MTSDMRVEDLTFERRLPLTERMADAVRRPQMHSGTRATRRHFLAARMAK